MKTLLNSSNGQHDLDLMERLENWRLIDLFGTPLEKYVTPFFRYPRVVIGFDTNIKNSTKDTPLLKNRLFLGFHDKTKTLELISYNDELARFEFQVVKDFQKNGKKQVVYQKRALCLGCHQNHAPHFPLGVWEETNAGNPEMQKLLEKHIERKAGEDRNYYFGTAIKTGQDSAALYNLLTDTSNTFAIAQAIWKKICTSMNCRKQALHLMLQYRLSSGSDNYQQAELFEKYKTIFSQEWKNSEWANKDISLPNPDLPKRSPLTHFRENGARKKDKRANIADFINAISNYHNPVRFRGKQKTKNGNPLPAYNLATELKENRFIKILADHFFSSSDIVRIDKELNNNTDNLRTFEIKCSVRYTKRRQNFYFYNCKLNPDIQQGPSSYSFTQLEHLININMFASNLKHSEDFKQLEFQPTIDSVSVKDLSGNSIQKIEANYTSRRKAILKFHINNSGQKLIELIDNLDLEQLNTVNMPVFHRRKTLYSIYQAMNLTEEEFQMEEAPIFFAESQFQQIAIPPFQQVSGTKLFQKNCASCHSDSFSTFFPNFLYSSNNQVEKSIELCAPRIYARLMMWDIDRDLLTEAEIKQDKYPAAMPLLGNITSLEIEKLKAETAQILKTSSLRENQNLVHSGFLELSAAEIDYYSLPSCPDGE